MKFLIALCFAFFFLAINCQTIRVGLYTEKSLESIELSGFSGQYLLILDSIVKEISPKDFLDIKIIEGNQMLLSLNQKLYSSPSKISLIQLQNKNTLLIQSSSSNLKKISFEGDFEISILDKRLNIINSLDIEDYIRSVVVSESGINLDLEYYKVQAVISRTYAMKYWQRHENHSFNMCNTTHCQVYGLRKNTNPLIDSAVKSTRSFVMKYKDDSYYPTFFHANCGGQTSETDYIWNEKMACFKSFQDTFCRKTKQANWEKEIPLEKWLKFLVEKYNFPVNDEISMALMSNFIQEKRMAFFIHPRYGIPLRDLRDEFDLKSTFFNCQVKDNMVYLKGKGNGHGVGLCQEGAIIMASKGYDFKQILAYYYSDMYLDKIVKLRLNR